MNRFGLICSTNTERGLRSESGARVRATPSGRFASEWSVGAGWIRCKHSLDELDPRQAREQCDHNGLKGLVIERDH